MATVKKATAKREVKWTAQKIMSAYMEDVLNRGEEPITVYKFCKEHKLEEPTFYTFFGSFKSLRKQIWVAFFDNTVAVLNKDKDFESYENKEKMLSFFFTMFEMLTANRSYVLYALENEKMTLKRLHQLQTLRHKIKAFAGELIEVENEDITSRISKRPVAPFSEGAWAQFLFLLHFWMNDESSGFEKTDVAIEKSVKAIFDVFQTSPLESIVDFGKFLMKERVAFGKL